MAVASRCAVSHEDLGSPERTLVSVAATAQECPLAPKLEESRYTNPPRAVLQLLWWRTWDGARTVTGSDGHEASGTGDVVMVHDLEITSRGPLYYCTHNVGFGCWRGSTGTRRTPFGDAEGIPRAKSRVRQPANQEHPSRARGKEGSRQQGAARSSCRRREPLRQDHGFGPERSRSTTRTSPRPRRPCTRT